MLQVIPFRSVNLKLLWLTVVNCSNSLNTIYILMTLCIYIYTQLNNSDSVQ